MVEFYLVIDLFKLNFLHVSADYLHVFKAINNNAMNVFLPTVRRNVGNLSRKVTLKSSNDKKLSLSSKLNLAFKINFKLKIGIMRLFLILCLNCLISFSLRSCITTPWHDLSASFFSYIVAFSCLLSSVYFLLPFFPYASVTAIFSL